MLVGSRRKTTYADIMRLTGYTAAAIRVGHIKKSDHLDPSDFVMHGKDKNKAENIQCKNIYMSSFHTANILLVLNYLLTKLIKDVINRKPWM